METVTDFTSLVSKITADGDCSHEIKRHLLLGRKAMTNLDSILKSRDITLLTKVCRVKAIVFPVVMYGCESWTIKKAESQCFWIVVLEKTLESPLGCKEIKAVNPKGNQSWILIRTDAEAEAPRLWPPDLKIWLTRKTLMLGKFEGRTRRGWQRMRWLHGITDSRKMSLSNLCKMVSREAWCAAVHRVAKSWTGLSTWTATTESETEINAGCTDLTDMHSYSQTMRLSLPLDQNGGSGKDP